LKEIFDIEFAFACWSGIKTAFIRCAIFKTAVFLFQ